MVKNPVAIAAVVLGILVVIWLVYPKNEEYRIRQRLHELADVVSSTQQQRDAARLYVEGSNTIAQAAYTRVGLSTSSYRVFEDDFVFTKAARPDT